ncbi:MAG: hypothetical protein JWP48_7003 [Actinoallomurus sp.]|nr:hypothetical protein [Actinoallomurus sp.]
MRKPFMIAECLRRYAWWRLNRSDEHDEGRNARSAVALLNAAAYVAELPEDAPVITRLCGAGTFAGEEFRLPVPAERIVRFWHYEEPGGVPEDLLEAIAAMAEPPKIPAQRDGEQPLHR